MQIGGGVNTDNAKQWLDAGASHVIVTSFVFREGRLEEDRLKALVRAYSTMPCAAQPAQAAVPVGNKPGAIADVFAEGYIPNKAAQNLGTQLG